MRWSAACLISAFLGVLLASPSHAANRGVFAVAYESEAALARTGGEVLRVFPRLHVAEVRASRSDAAAARGMPGIRYVERTVLRLPAVEPALFAPSPFGGPLEWQFAATRADAVPDSVLRAAAGLTIAVVDTGADLSAPDLAAKRPRTHNVRTPSPDVRDQDGHGTFVAALAAGSVTNGEGIAGFGGDARLLVIKASSPDGSFTDVDEANAIVYAVDQGARVINLSFGGPETSETERRALDYAVAHDALVVAAVGNEFRSGNPVEYPAALLQPVGSNGSGGVGLSVGASTRNGTRASFSNTGSHVSLLAPGEYVFGALASTAPTRDFVSVTLPGATSGDYGFGSGTSFAAPEVAGAAALVMAANPLLRAGEVAAILKQTATNRGVWNASVGFGVIDVGAAVLRASNRPGISLDASRAGAVVGLRWSGADARAYRLSVRQGTRRSVVLLARSKRTSASYRLPRGPTYVFTVTALDAAGASIGAATAAVH